MAAPMTYLCDHAVCLSVDTRFGAEWPRVCNLFAGRVGSLDAQVNGEGDALPRAAYQFLHGPIPGTWRAAPNAYWCYRGILEIVRTAKAAGWSEVLVVEDDCDLAADFDNVVTKARGQLNGITPDILYYGANHVDATTLAVGPNVLRVEGSYTTHCVQVRRTAYDAILALTPDDAIDWQFAKKIHPRFGCYAVWPNVAVQRPGYSTILGRHADYTECWQTRGRQVR